MFGRRVYEDEQLISSALQELTRTSSVEPLPDPSFIWWKAQLLRRFEAEREVTAPLEVGDRMHVGGAILGAVALAAGVWDRLPALSLSPVEVLAGGLGALVLLSVVGLAAVESMREH